MEDLSGHFLISTPQMPDPRFQEQVILLCAHNKEGAMGVVINKPNEEISMMEVLLSTNISLPEGPLPPVYNGGPVEMEAGFILYSSDYEGSNALKITQDVYLSRESKLLEKISKGDGPEKYMFLLGYAGWGPGRLEDELMDNSWLTVPGDMNVLFNTPDDKKWRQAARRYGINISIFSNIVGNA